MTITLDQARQIADATLAQGSRAGAAPLTVAVLDAGGHLVVLNRQDGSGIVRPQIAIGKAWGALGLGISSRAIAATAEARPSFVNALAVASDGRAVPAAGGVLLREVDGGPVIGAVGVTGDNSDVDEACAIAGALEAGLRPDPSTPVA
jgi:uncharacterized protein GlcG (DUF336 family)